MGRSLTPEAVAESIFAEAIFRKAAIERRGSGR